MIRRFPILLFWLILSIQFCIGQQFVLPKGQKFEKVRFELINNLMVVPVEINGAKLKFVLDTGVSNPILFNLTDQDSVQINQVSEITLRGLGEGEPIKALKSEHNRVRLGNATNLDQRLFVVLDKEINFSTSMGMTIHGIIGYELFKSFVVEVNYANETLKLFPPSSYVYKTKGKQETVPISLVDKKAYVVGSIDTEKKDNIPVRLLLDTGSSDALWLFHDTELGLEVPEDYYEDFLGKGLSGNIYGKRSKLKGFRLGSFSLFDAKTAFPYKESFGLLTELDGRNGSIGGEILKRFNFIIDYSKRQLTLRKNSLFKTPFQYNFAGIDLQHNGMRYISERIADSNGFVTQKDKGGFGNVQILMQNRTRLSLVPEIVVSAIRAGSPADRAGLQEGDVILAVNGKRVYNYKLQEILQMINEHDGKRVKLLIERYNKDLVYSFIVEDVFKTKKPR
ncbi:PDZ domain-containing protein [Croceivirga thetidis]|uniref:PDZ domain-containing protein n=1 Tax=Croceivirga thetidis TaxID=2721623 RepID=A0ABX1GTV1_9FLAO|nr:PDZ domain-containing protein [Croceivirga thetidis]NKI33346.1 PDZ domain-containing protein [Croceivirga thetidis]